MNESTVTYKVEITAIFRDQPGAEEALMSDAFKESLRQALLVMPWNHDVHLSDIRVFIDKEGIEE